MKDNKTKPSAAKGKTANKTDDSDEKKQAEKIKKEAASPDVSASAEKPAAVKKVASPRKKTASSAKTAEKKPPSAAKKPAGKTKTEKVISAPVPAPATEKKTEKAKKPAHAVVTKAPPASPPPPKEQKTEEKTDIPAAPEKTTPAETPPPEPVIPEPEKKKYLKIISVDENITVGKLAEKLGIRAVDLIRKMMTMGVMSTINQRIDTDTASLMAHEYECDVEMVQLYGEEILKEEAEKEKESPEALVKRPPIVTVMGHVDHGKTSLLDAIRSTSVAKKEVGGITQHIGAYKVIAKGQEIVFIDTPGHEAFTAMRARGAQATDIVVLVVAADDGVMPQTVEAINHARAADVPILVAVNKMDLPAANPERVLSDLSKHNLVAEKWGGKVQVVNVSARTGLGIDDLLTAILLEAEVMELKANPNKRATGTVLEGKIDKRKGPIATVLIQTGTLKLRDPFIVGATYGRVKAMQDDLGNHLREAPPATPVEIMGFSSLPNIGDRLVVVESDSEAKHIGEIRQEQYKSDMKKKGLKVGLENLHQIIKSRQMKELRIILKADVAGSMEALSDQIERLSNSEVVLNVIHASTGNITMTDVSLASASNAIILGYHINVDDDIMDAADKEGVTVRNHSIIFEAVTEIKLAMEGLLEPDIIDKLLGKAVVRKIFSFSKVGKIAGCYVTEGKLVRGKTAKIMRQGSMVFTGPVSSLKRFKNDTKEVEKGFECGLTMDNFIDFAENDIVEVYTKEKIYRKLTEK